MNRKEAAASQAIIAICLFPLTFAVCCKTQILQNRCAGGGWVEQLEGKATGHQGFGLKLKLKAS